MMIPNLDYDQNWCNRTNLMDPYSPIVDDNYQFRYYACGPLLTFFIFIGILGNTACLYVFKPCNFNHVSRSANRTPPIFVYLFTLAVWELILLFASFFLYNLPEWTRGVILANPTYALSKPYIYFITNAAHTNSNWIVVALGLERYLALCHPFKHWLLDNGKRRASYIVTLISVIGIIYNLPRLFEVLDFTSGLSSGYTETATVGQDHAVTVYQSDIVYQTVTVPPGTVHQAVTVHPVTVRQNMLYRTLYKILGGTIFYSVGPFFCLLIVSIRVSTAIRRQRSQQCRLRERRKTERMQMANRGHQRRPNDQCSYSINIMLISVIIKLLIVHSLPTGLDVAETVMGDQAFSNDTTIDYLITFLTLLLAINASSNFFIYYACSKRFRQQLHKKGMCKGRWDMWWPRRSVRYNEAYPLTGATSTLIIRNGNVAQVDL